MKTEESLSSVPSLPGWMNCSLVGTLGYGTEIIRLIDTAVDKQVSVLSALVEKENTASQKCFERNGYVRDEDTDVIKYIKVM